MKNDLNIKIEEIEKTSEEENKLPEMESQNMISEMENI